MKRAIFLDRDGVLNQAIIKNGMPFPPKSIDEVVISDDVLPSLNRLKASGFLLIGVTNQPDVARGETSRTQVELINSFLVRNLPIDEIWVCYHDDEDQCHCRKPKPGLILESAHAWQVNLKSSYMIGDRWRDIEAGQAAGCKTLWLDANYLEKSPEQLPTFRVKSLREAANEILNDLKIYGSSNQVAG